MRVGFAAVMMALTAGLTLATLQIMRPPLGRVWGDEGSYLAMSASLAVDGDLHFGPEDIERELDSGHLEGIILQRTGAGVCYSKPVLYPLVVAPFMGRFGIHAGVVVNVVALVLSLLLAAAYLHLLGESSHAWLTLVTFFGTGAVLPYALWRMSEALEFSLVLSGLVLSFARCRRPVGPVSRGGYLLSRPMAAIVGMVILGLAASIRLPNAALGVLPVAVALGERKWKRASAYAVAGLVGFLSIVVVTYQLTGAANPYRSARAGFSSSTGFPAGDDAGAAFQRFDTHPGRHWTGALPELDTRPLYAFFYFLTGRHTGLLIYYPAAALLLFSALRRPDRYTLALHGGALVVALFYAGWMPWNYFGGATFTGNRYYLAVYPAFLVALGRLPGLRYLAAAWVIAGVTWCSAVVSIARTSGEDNSSQSHAAAGVFRYLPYESVASDLDGVRDRYWSGDLVRFLDPYAEVGRTEFQLATGQPGADLMIASRHAGEPLLLVTADRSDAVLEMRDWARRRTYALASSPAGGGRSFVRLSPATAWRWHPFWWDATTTYRAQVLRLTLTAPAGIDARATLLYLGNGADMERGFEHRVERFALPDTAIAGTVSTVTVRVQNTSEVPWTSDAVLPIRASYRLRPEGEVGAPIEGNRVELLQPVEPWQSVDLVVPVCWPTDPGSYRLTVDLVREQIAWFGDRTDGPLAEGSVLVVAVE